MEEQKDIYQVIIAEAWRPLSSFNGEARIGTWIYRLAVNTAMSYNRKKETRQNYHSKYKKEQGKPTFTPKDHGQDEMLSKLYRAIVGSMHQKKLLSPCIWVILVTEQLLLSLTLLKTTWV